MLRLFDPNKNDLQDPARWLGLVYFFVLVSLVLVACLTQLVIRRHINKQTDDATIINLSGRQRMLSQRMVKCVLLLEFSRNDYERSALWAEMDESFDTWTRNHVLLREGRVNARKITPNSPEVMALFDALQPSFEALRDNFKSVLTNQELQAELRSDILSNQRSFLTLMDAITFQFDEEANEKIRQLKRKELFLFLAAICILLAEGLFVFRPTVASISKLFHKLRDAQNELNEKELKLRQSRQILLKATIEAEERERSRIARELHDGLGSEVAMTRMMIAQLSSQATPHVAAEAIKTLTAQLDSIAQTIRDISASLSPGVLEHFGLEEAIRMLVEKYIPIFPGDIRLYMRFDCSACALSDMLHVYRMAQELLHNAVIHAQATEISVQLIETDGRLTLLVEDDGRGFGEKNPYQNPGLGLKNLLSRVKVLKGEMNIDSRPGHGASILISLPINKNHG